MRNRYSDQNKTIKLKEVLDRKALQSLMDDFYALINVGIGIIDLDGEVLVATGWQDICMHFHRVNKSTLKNCIESDTYLFNNIHQGEYLEYKCRNHMRDIATPIFINDQHVGNIFLGQFFYEDEVPDLEVFEKQAELYGFDKDEYLKALQRVPRWSREKVNTVLSMYSKFSAMISRLLENNLRLHQLLAENERVIRALEQSNEELEQYAYIASHDLQEPLRMVTSFTQLLSTRYENMLDWKADEYIAHILDGTKRMHGLINDVLAFSRISKPQNFVTVDLNEILQDVLNEMEVVIIGSKASISAGNLPVINADPIQVKQVFQNLIQNSIKFRSKCAPEILICAEEKNDKWVISVRDNGIGISPEYKDKIFVMFQRLHEKEKYPGTGIGLAICRKIIERHGGRIWVDTSSDCGTTFFFTFPKQDVSVR